jgi:hypothetical protein
VPRSGAPVLHQRAELRQLETLGPVRSISISLKAEGELPRLPCELKAHVRAKSIAFYDGLGEGVGCFLWHVVIDALVAPRFHGRLRSPTTSTVLPSARPEWPPLS